MLADIRELIFTHSEFFWSKQFEFIYKFLELSGYNEVRSIVYFAVVFLSIVPSFSFYAFLTESDPELRISSVVFLCGQLQILGRHVAYLIKHETIWALKESIVHTKFETEMESSTVASVERKYFSLLKKIAKCLFFGWSILPGIYAAIPLVVSNDWTLPGHSPVIGISHKTYSGYTISYLVIILQFILNLFVTVPMEFSLIMGCIYVISRFHICMNFSGLIGDMDSEYNTDKKQKELLKFIIQTHSQATAVLEQLKEIFEISTITTMMTGAIILCISIIQLTKVSMLSNASIGIFAGLMQIGYFSIMGEIILTKHDEFATSVYCSNWYQLNDVGLKKMVLVILMKTQSFEGLRFRGVLHLSMETFAQVLKFCYSTISFLAGLF